MDIEKLNSKKILIIGIGFYDYEQCVVDFLRSNGAIVSYFSSDLYTLGKGLLHRLKLHYFATKLVENKLKRLIKVQPGDMDYVLIFKALNFKRGHFELLKDMNPDAFFVLYLWDSMKRLFNKKEILTFNGPIYTFDRYDSEKYAFKFRPLFARIINCSQTSAKYAISFVGYDHSIRYNIVKAIKKQCEKAGISYNFILIISSKWKFIGLHITHRINKDDESLFRTKNLDYKDYIKILNESNAILDIAHPKQTGLTMRTIETFGLGKKIVTTNPDIIFYNFDPKQYFIINPQNPVVDISFLSRNNYLSTDMTYYSIKSFICELLNVS